MHQIAEVALKHSVDVMHYYEQVMTEVGRPLSLDWSLLAEHVSGWLLLVRGAEGHVAALDGIG